MSSLSPEAPVGVQFGAPTETLFDALLAAAERYGGREFLVVGRREEAITFADLAARAERLAMVLWYHGARPGDRIALWMTNHVEWPVAAFAVARIGCVMVAVSTRLTAREVANIIDLCQPKLLVMEDVFLDRIQAMPILRDVLRRLEDKRVVAPQVVLLRMSGSPPDEVIDGAAEMQHSGRATVLAPATKLAAEAGKGEHPNLLGVAAILLTSGTTGEPKGVMLGHYGLLRLARALARRQALGPSQRFYSIAPFFHCSGLTHGLLTNLVAGSTYFAPNAYSPEETMSVIRDEAINAYHGFIEPLQYMADSGQVAPGDLRAFDRAWYSAPAARMAQLEQVLAVKMCEVYGLTEVGGNVSICTVDDAEAMRYDSDGRPHEGLEARIVDPSTGTELPEGQAGEIKVRGWNVMRGYFRDPEATAKSIDPEGWLSTGDQGQVLPGGYLRFVSRLKDIIRVGGENFAPAEVESVLLTHPAVFEVAVVAVPDPRLGEVPVAFLQLRGGRGQIPEDIEEFCRQRLAKFKRPRRFILIDEFPRTGATNRIQKALLGQFLLKQADEI